MDVSKFQSLGRDSVGWDRAIFTWAVDTLAGFNPSVGILWGGTFAAALLRAGYVTVSIPRSGFCGVGPGHLSYTAPPFPVSIPRSGFCGVGPRRGGRGQSLPRPVSIPRSGFCGVGRGQAPWPPLGGEVSIPRSGFCGVGRHPIPTNSGVEVVSIPRSGFCGVGRGQGRGPPPRTRSFNPSVGILWGGTS